MMFSYTTYGIPLASAIPFRSPLPPSSEQPRLSIHLRPLAPRPEALRTHYAPPPEVWDAAAPNRIVEADDGREWLDFPDGHQIEVTAQAMSYRSPAEEGPPRPDFVDVRLLGSGLAWWLLAQGRLPLHAAAIEGEGGATLFLAESGAGKSSLTASLVATGRALLCDDFTTIAPGPDGRLWAYPAYPQMRLWPETIRRFVGDPDDYPTVFFGGTKRRVPLGQGWGRFLAQPQPVATIYLLERLPDSTEPITVETLTGHSAFMQLLAAALMVTAFPTERLGPVWELTERLSQQARVQQLRYPSGWQWIPALHRHIR